MFKKISLICAGLAVAATATFAGSHQGPHAGAIKARQSHMQLYAFNLGILGGMARGNTEYNAEAAMAAAANMAALTSLAQSAYWPAGSDNASAEGSKALPNLWTDFAGAAKIGGDLAAASANLAAVAGDGLEALQGAMGPIGGACGACHKTYREAQ